MNPMVSARVCAPVLRGEEDGQELLHLGLVQLEQAGHLPLVAQLRELQLPLHHLAVRRLLPHHLLHAHKGDTSTLVSVYEVARATGGFMTI